MCHIYLWYIFVNVWFGGMCNVLVYDWQGWRWAWIISGIPGIVLSAVMLISVSEPVRSTEGFSTGVEIAQQNSATQLDVNWRYKAAVICRTFFQPSLLVLCIAGSVRNAGLKLK